MKSLPSVTLIAPFADGHNIYYASLLATELEKDGVRVYAIGPARFINALASKGVITDSDVLEMPPLRPVIGEIRKLDFLKNALRKADHFGAERIHLLQLDRFILPLSLLSGGDRQLCATLHWASFLREFQTSHSSAIKSRVLSAALKRLVAGGLSVMVHSKILAERLNQQTASAGFCYVPYPADFAEADEGEQARKKTAIRKRFNISDEATLLLCFGGTRYEKGADLAVKALRHLPDNFYLLVAGEERDISYRTLEQTAKGLGVLPRLRLFRDFIPEGEIRDFFIASDVFLAPYRKAFGGQSGPLTIAASLGRPVICSQSLVMEETVNNYSLGATFPIEDVDGMAKAITAVLREDMFRPKFAEFRAAHSRQSFHKSVLDCYLRIRG